MDSSRVWEAARALASGANDAVGWRNKAGDDTDDAGAAASARRRGEATGGVRHHGGAMSA